MIKSNETLISSSKDLESLTLLRAKIIETIPFIWVYIYKFDKEYKLTVTTAFLKKVSKEVLEKIEALKAPKKKRKN